MDQGAQGRELGYEPREITEEQVAEAGPRVRWQVVERYEDLWKVVSGHIEAAQEVGRPVDPRYLELGIRILKEETGLYRLGRPAPITEDEDDVGGGVDRAAAVAASLKEIEARMNAMREQQGTKEPEAGV